MDEQATATQHSVVGVRVKINKGFNTMWGFRVQLRNKFNSSHSGYANTTIY
jgi:hypothetical protein